MLATHPEIQTKLREELAALTEAHNGSLGADSLRKSALLEV